MKKYTVFDSATAAPAAAKSKLSKGASLLKIGLDLHRHKFVVVAQYDQATLRRPRSFARSLLKVGAHCYVIAPQQLDEDSFSLSPSSVSLATPE